MKIKKLCCSLLIAVTTLSGVITSYADIITYTADGITKTRNSPTFYWDMLPKNTSDFVTATVDDGEGWIKNLTYMQSKVFPSWLIRDGGYYYYFDTISEILKNTTTPDGYTVDSLGRWIDSNGTPITANMGNNTIGTKEKYAGKTDNEIKDIQMNYLRSLYKDGSKGYDEVGCYTETTSNQFSSTTVQFNVIDITWNIVNTWSAANRTDFCSVDISKYTEVTKQTELVLRLMFGDDLGVEIFNDIKAIPNTNLDADCEGCAVRDLANKFDLNKYKGRTTDYGKTLDVRIDEFYGDLYFELY